MDHTASKSEWILMTRKKMTGAKVAVYTATISSIGKILAPIADEIGVRVIEAETAIAILAAATDDFFYNGRFSSKDVPETFHISPILASCPVLVLVLVQRSQSVQISNFSVSE